MVSEIKFNPFTAEQHLKFFAEFVQAVHLAGGTTPHMLMTVEAARRQKKVEEKLWWAGCYAFVYNFATAEIIYNTWRPGKFSRDEIISWAQKNWLGIKFRKERKAARSPERLSECMETYSRFAQRVPLSPWFYDTSIPPHLRYDMAFDDICSSVKYMGRYIAIRWIEVIRRVFDLDGLQMPDLRPEDGDHPRKAMALIFPEYHDVLMGGNSPEEIRIVNELAEELKTLLYTKFGVSTDYYTMQSLLCEYKQSALSKKQFPGKSIDSELVYFSKVYSYWGEEAKERSIMWDVRAAIFPDWALGEKSGWDGLREELGGVLTDYSYTWSDFLYDYKKTVFSGSFQKPVLRNPLITTVLPKGN